MVAAADRSAGGWWRACSALSLIDAVSRENFIVGPHKSDCLIMSLIMHRFRTNIHDLQINKCFDHNAHEKFL
jgi:hypothetical protein